MIKNIYEIHYSVYEEKRKLRMIEVEVHSETHGVSTDRIKIKTLQYLKLIELSSEIAIDQIVKKSDRPLTVDKDK